MPIVKKLIFLVLIFIGFIIYSVYSFDYDSQAENKTSMSALQKADNKQINNGLFDNLINKFSSPVVKKETKPFSLELFKKDGVIVMNGTFASIEESKVVFNMLNINRDGVYSYNDNILTDEILLEKIAKLMPLLKDLFYDNVKLTIVNNEVFLSGELKDANHYLLLESVISKAQINLTKDIKIPAPIIVKEEIKPEPVVKKVLTLNEIQTMINDVLVVKKVAFERKSSIITENSYSTLTQIAKILNEHKNTKIEIGGHTDSRGEKELNKQISQDRANSVRDALITLGISAERLTAVGYGEDFPIAKDDENGLSEINRRVEFNIKGELK
jgi:outer membrane protein OmpA-like peptidoglycan-associated protein